MIQNLLFMSGKSIGDFLITNWYYCVIIGALLSCFIRIRNLWRKSSEQLYEWNIRIFGLCIVIGSLISFAVLIIVWQLYTSKQSALDGIIKAISSLLAIVAAVPTIYLWAVREKKKEQEITQKKSELELKKREIDQKDTELEKKDEENKKQAQQNAKTLNQQKLENERNERHRENTLKQQEIAELNRSYVEAINQFSDPQTFLAGSYALIGLINNWLEIGTSTAHNKAHQMIYILFSKRTALRKNTLDPSYLETSEYSLFENLISELFLDEKYLPLYTGDTGFKFNLIDMSNLGLKYAHLSGARLLGTNLSHASLLFANLTHANLSGARILSAKLTDARLLGSNLSNADLTRANLSGARLFSANLSDAALTDADLTGADLTGANLINAKFNKKSFETANLTDKQLKSIVIIDPENI